MVDDASSELNLRAIRVIETRLSNLCGDVSASETTRLLALELSQPGEGINLVGAIAAAGAVAIILTAQALGIAPEHVVEELRTLMAPNVGSG